MKTVSLCTLAAAAWLALGVAHAAPASSLVDFSSGAGGWEGVNPSEPIEGQGTWIDDSLGQAAPALHTVNPETFMVTWTNSTSAWTGDYTASPKLTIGLDVNALSIVNLFTGQQVARDLVVELRDYDNTSGGYPWTSVWFNLGTIAAGLGWQHLEVTIDDTSALALPAGWGGYGDENEFAEPILPANRTFADVLAGVDEIAFTTATPGYVYGFTYFDVALDNIQIAAVPEPATLALQALGLTVLGVAVRRRRRTA